MGAPARPTQKEAGTAQVRVYENSTNRGVRKPRPRLKNPASESCLGMVQKRLKSDGSRAASREPRQQVRAKQVRASL